MALIFSPSTDTLIPMADSIHRLAANVLIDTAVAWQPAQAAGLTSPMNVAVQRLTEPDVTRVTISDDCSTVDIDVSPIVNAAVVSIFILAFRLSQATGVSIEVVFAQLREEHEQLWTGQ